MAQLGLDLPHEGRGDPLFVLVCGGVQVEDLDDLRNLQLVAHIADLVHVVVGFPGLKFGRMNISSCIVLGDFNQYYKAPLVFL